jgi:hypothetical protein
MPLEEAKVSTDLPPIVATAALKEDVPKPAQETNTSALSVLEGDGYRDDRNEGSYENTSDWIGDHTTNTPKGSLIVGTLHNDSESNTEIIRKQIIPRIIEEARKLLELLPEGKKIVFLAEGEKHGSPDSEQEMIAVELDKLIGSRIEHDTWDDEALAIYGDGMKIDFGLPLIKKLIKKFNDAVIVEAALYAMNRGDYEGFPISSKARKYLESTGIDPENKDALEKKAFPSKYEKDTIVAEICREYNRLRQENMLNKIKRIEDNEGIAIVAPGSSHAYSLKFILEKGHY